ncbi:DUF342 domain-containing protein [Anaerobranca gottschalkii]|uniref:Flagellar Assembly Protein A N-terminal region domain-containing protein n=1 Tax=Anaerobranca gottschalkii DSM 13577 TaxID=1120990 RepID=A0A1H9ZCP0_9FIRM|nr:FapA family protein [Anaerobranca gottschalkii]SES79102.1 hypothetical protein SAMN03080614_100816 [Anaerobranca gottschalkii DSM 13577]
MNGNKWFRINITKDKLAAFLELSKPGVELSEIELEEIVNEIRKNNLIVQSLEMVKERIKRSTGLEEIQIATGTPAVSGKDGYVKIHFQEKDGKPVILEDGRVDFYNLEKIINIKKGDTLATIYPPEPGIDGLSVTGEIIPFKPGKPAKLPLGKNVQLQGDNTIIASVDGKFSLIEGKLNVFQILEVEEVNFKTGNIDFIGSVIVKGDVKEGFTIKAQGDVTVKGTIDSSYIYCEGNLVVNGGIQGRNKGVINSKGNIVARYIENCEVKAGGSVIIKDAIMYSKVHACDRVVVTEGKGLIVGGIVGAEQEILANIVGSPKGTKTELEVGVNPELRHNLQMLTKELTIKSEELKKAKQAQRILKLKEEKGQLSKEHRCLLERLEVTIESLTDYLEDKQKLQKEMLDKLLNNVMGKVTVNKIVYPGVKVTIGTRYRTITDETKTSNFIIGPDGEIMIT